MVGGTLEVLADAPIDIIGKYGFELIAIGLFIWFTIHVRKRVMKSRNQNSV
jgi:hypothetical protein